MAGDTSQSQKSVPRAIKRTFWDLPDLTKLDRRKREWVYFVQTIPAPHLIKIGKAQALRWRLLTLQTMSPVELKLVGAITGPPGTEHVVHMLFTAHRLHGEWFRPAAELLLFIRDLPKGGPVRQTQIEHWAQQAGVDLQKIILQARSRRNYWGQDSLGRSAAWHQREEVERGEMLSSDYRRLDARFPQ